jgi:hypothetical protein
MPSDIFPTKTLLPSRVFLIVKNLIEFIHCSANFEKSESVINIQGQAAGKKSFRQRRFKRRAQPIKQFRALLLVALHGMEALFIRDS